MKTDVRVLFSSNGNTNDKILVMIAFILEVAEFVYDWLTCIEFDCLLEVPEVCLCLFHGSASGCTNEDC